MALPGQLALFWVLNHKTDRLVMSEVSPKPMELPDFHQEDGPEIAVTTLKRVRWGGTPYFEKLSLNGKSMRASVGIAGNVYATADLATLSADGYTLSGRLLLNTAALNALADNTEVLFELRHHDGTAPYKVQVAVRFRKAVYTAGALSSPVTDVALGALEAKRTYMKKQGDPGEGFILVSADSNSSCFEYLANDGSRRSEPLV